MEIALVFLFFPISMTDDLRTPKLANDDGLFEHRISSVRIALTSRRRPLLSRPLPVSLVRGCVYSCRSGMALQIPLPRLVSAAILDGKTVQQLSPLPFHQNQEAPSAGQRRREIRLGAAPTRTTGKGMALNKHARRGEERIRTYEYATIRQRRLV
jgi:hypothetical protein